MVELGSTRFANAFQRTSSPGARSGRTCRIPIATREYMPRGPPRATVRQPAAQPEKLWLPTTERSFSRSASSLPGAAVKMTRRSVRFSAVRTWQSSFEQADGRVDDPLAGVAADADLVLVPERRELGPPRAQQLDQLARFRILAAAAVDGAQARDIAARLQLVFVLGRVGALLGIGEPAVVELG